MTVEQLQRFNSIEDPSDLEQAACYLSISPIEASKLSMEQVEAAALQLQIDMEKIQPVMRDLVFYDEVKGWNLNTGKPYGIINEWDKITGGEYFDIVAFQKDYWANATKILSIMYRPCKLVYGENYEIEPYQGVKGHEIFKDFPADWLAGVMLFFSIVRKKSAKTSLSYFKTALLTSLAQSGHGTGWWQNLLQTLRRSKT